MRYLATIHAVDVMTTVHVVVNVRAQNTRDATWSTVADKVLCLNGVGETDPAEWLRDVLIQLLEDT